MSPAAFWEVVGGQDLISISRPQQQLLFTQLYASANSFCCDEQSGDGQGEAFAVGSLHSLGEEGDKSRTQFYLTADRWDVQQRGWFYCPQAQGLG